MVYSGMSEVQVIPHTVQSSGIQMNSFRGFVAGFKFSILPAHTLPKEDLLFSHSVVSKSFATPHGLYPPCSSVREISRQEYRDGLPFPPGSFQRKDQICISLHGRQILPLSHREAQSSAYLIHLTLYIFLV